MIEVIGSAACVALVTALAYVERTKLKADVKSCRGESPSSGHEAGR